MIGTRATGRTGVAGVANYKGLWNLAWRGKRCVVCGTKRAVAGHHIVYAQHLRRENAPSWDPRNCLPICFDCHGAHHNASRRIPVTCLHNEAFEFAEEFGFSWYFDTYYLKEPAHGCAA